ncbi:hypothetical protein HYN56_13985 [Flavobacterium crocinum]|uniref:DUF4304 domain-containing protein n=1 Tax=Flavobacterium crocinum TaxID=2183896 RepID=A0A2S1YMH4_9FLAO|nr:hypothetical protein [Flavobacterium crocinum]AWK05284.1 hypothetical protein HYN56_13985 [Flavobacterium crocinum]
MNEKLNFVNDYITAFITHNFPEFSRFKIKINEDALYFHNNTNGYKHEIFVGLGELTYPDHKIVNGGFHCWVGVNFVENLLIELISKHDLHLNQLHPTIWFNEFTISNFSSIWDSFKQFKDYDLSTNKEILDKLCNHYKEIINQHFIPFWDIYSNIQYINDEIIDIVPEEEVNNYFPGMGNFKKLIIMKLCSNSNYNDYKNYLVTVAENAVIVDPVKYKPYANLFNELTEKLENL